MQPAPRLARVLRLAPGERELRRPTMTREQDRPREVASEWRGGRAATQSSSASLPRPPVVCPRAAPPTAAARHAPVSPQRVGRASPSVVRMARSRLRLCSHGMKRVPATSRTPTASASTEPSSGTNVPGPTRPAGEQGRSHPVAQSRRWSPVGFPHRKCLQSEPHDV